MIELVVPEWPGYALLDSGDGLRLERVGGHTLVRPDANVVWKPSDPEYVGWKQPELRYEGKSHKGSWLGSEQLMREGWEFSYKKAVGSVEPNAYGHIGFFPEQAGHWQWIEEICDTAVNDGVVPQVLNLFAYTGMASIIAAQHGAQVCHVDASKASMYRAKENAQRSGLPADAIRWIVDDALKFMQREVRRGHTYDIIIMDPPVFGRGPKGEIWRLEEQVSELAALTAQLLSKHPRGVLVNVYATALYPDSVRRVFQQALPSMTLETGVLSLQETISKKSLPTGFFIRG